MFSKLLLAFLVLKCLALTFAYPASVTYDNETLRFAKAAQMKAYLNEEQNLCENFYNFACGKWSILQPATETQPKTKYTQKIQEVYEYKLIQVLKNNQENRKLVNFYKSCLQKKSLKEIYMRPALDVVDFAGGWPDIVSVDWYEKRYDWLHVVAELRRKLGLNIFIDLEVVPNNEGVGLTHSLKVGPPKLELETPEAYLNSDMEYRRENYKHIITKSLRHYFPHQPEPWAEEVAQQVLNLEVELAKGLSSNSSQHMRFRTVDQLQADYGKFVHFKRYLQDIFNETILFGVYEASENYFSNLVDVIEKTKKLELANYTMWRAIQYFEEEAEQYNTVNDKWCVQKLEKFFPQELQSIFYHNYTHMHMTNEIRHVWDDVKKQFAEILPNWLKNYTLAQAKDKLYFMELELLKPEAVAVLEQVIDVQFNTQDFYGNLIAALEWNTKQEFKKFQNSMEEELPFILPKYNFKKNKIQIPPIFLQERLFWDEQYPTSLKYGTLGFLLAREMLHGFDQIGRRYDKYGNKVDNFALKFDTWAACFAEQLKDYKYRGKIVDDVNALDTSFAENGALVIANEAYKKWMLNFDKDADGKLPILHYNAKKLFYIGFAQMMCADYDASLSKIDELPAEFRVNNAVFSNHDFARTFECSSVPKNMKQCSVFHFSS